MTQVSSDPKMQLDTEFCFKGKGKRIKLEPESKVHWAPKGSYRLETMLKTIENLPDRSDMNIFNKEKHFGIYVVDDYAVHLQDEIRQALLKKGYILVIIGKQSF